MKICHVSRTLLKAKRARKEVQAFWTH